METNPERLKSFLARLLEAVGEEIPSARADLAVFGEGDKIAFSQSWPHSDGSMADHVEELMERSVRERRPLFKAEKDSWPAKNRSVGSRQDGQSLLCLPLLSAGRAIGAICLSRDSSSLPYSAEDMEALAAASRALFAFLQPLFYGQERSHCLMAQSDTEPIIGTSRSCRLIRTLIDRIKDTDAPVFIYGESGTGKELIARAIHEKGARRDRPFVAVNCGAIPDHLLESELFGHARGAFTGALRDKIGLIEEADGGTFFLDEIGDLSLPLQAKLLRLLQEKEIRRIGENRTRKVDVRFISATNKNIEQEIEQGNFRVDLYYRLRILTIEVPPLRERKGDLSLLLDHFVDKYAREMQRDRAHFSPRALELLMEYSWPGNIRELQNEIQRCLILCVDGDLITEEHLSPKINPQRGGSSPVSYDYHEAKAEFEKRFLNLALRRFGHSKTRTAEGIGLTRQGLFKLLKKHGLA